MQKMHLPEPNQDALQHSQALETKIIQTIQQSPEQEIDFSQYMNMALYEPSLGYYSSGSRKFGEHGDFITSPEVSPLFAQSLANPVAAALTQMSDADIIEFGAGSGALAADILLALEQLNRLPKCYFIIELSAQLQHRQQTTLQQRAPHLLHKVEWLQSLPHKKINAVVIANEVLDAMPVQRFIIQQNKIQQIGIRYHHQLQLHNIAANEILQLAVQTIESDLHKKLPEHYCSDVNTFIQPWLTSLSSSLEQAAIFLIDYGYHRAEYYAPERHMGTLMCYYQHRCHGDVLRYPGLQDITAFVDFTAVAEAALVAGFEVDGYTNQASFLLACGLADLAEQKMSSNIKQQLQLSQQVKTLTLPSEMGERFKVMALSKNLTKMINGFELRDFRDRL